MSTATTQIQRTFTEISPTESLALVRNLLRTAVSTISYMRSLFPDDCYSNVKIAGNTVKSLVKKTPESSALINWLERGVFDAIKKKYLKTIIFGICSDRDRDFETMFEAYEFTLDYPDRSTDEVQLTVSKTTNNDDSKQFDKPQTKKEITGAINQMVRTIVMLSQTMKSLPDTRFLTMKLKYYDEFTPTDYEPQFFRTASDEEKQQLSSDYIKIKIGSVTTRNHTMKLRLRTKDESFQAYDAETTDAENMQSKDTMRQGLHQPTIQDTRVEKEVNPSNPVKEPNAQAATDSTVQIEAMKNCEHIHHEDSEAKDNKERIYLQVIAIVLQQEEERVTIERIQKIAQCRASEAEELRERMQYDSILGKQSSKHGYRILQNVKSRKMAKELQEGMPHLWADAAPSKASTEAKPQVEVEEPTAMEEDEDEDATQDGLEPGPMSSAPQSTEDETPMESPKRNSQIRASRKRKLEDEFEFSNTQDTQTMSHIKSAKMSTVSDPISQKRVRIPRNANLS